MAAPGFRYNSYRLGATNNITIATTSTALASSAFSGETYQIRVSATAVCYMKIGDPSATPTATTSDALLPANWVDVITVTPGQKISIFSATTQTISIVELTG